MRLLAAADTLAVRCSAAPAIVLATLVAANVALGAVAVALGLALLDDPAIYFRELAPGTWISAGQILAAAVVARAIHLRQAGGSRRRHGSFWGVCAVLLAGLAVIELTQPTVFVGKWLQSDLGVRPPAGIADVDALLLIALLAGLAAYVLPRARVLLEHRKALPLLAAGAALGAASQTLDALWPVSAWEFVLEDGLKSLAEPFLVTGLLVVLASQRSDRGPVVSRR